MTVRCARSIDSWFARRELPGKLTTNIWAGFANPNNREICMRLETAIQALAVIIVSMSISGCGLPIKKEPLVDRYHNLVNESQLTQSRTQIEGAKSKVLAVILSKNTQSSLSFNASLRERFKSTTGSMTLNHGAIASDVDIVLSEEALLGALFVPLKSTFKEVRLANSIPEAFEGGADYVGVLDLNLNYVSLDSKWEPSPIIHIDHIANCSINFIDGNLVAGPDIAANVLYKQETEPKFPDANNRDFIFSVKKARSSLIELFARNVKASVTP